MTKRTADPNRVVSLHDSATGSRYEVPQRPGPSRSVGRGSC